jgi:periplasmic protein TonB
MANDLLNPPEIETAETTSPRDGRTVAPKPGLSSSAETGHELDAFLGKAFEEKSSFASLYEAIHEVFFPTKLPPLELTSTPIPVADPMATKKNPVAWTIAAVVNLAILAILLFAFRNKIIAVIKNPTLSNMDINLAPFKPKTPKAGNIGGGGGGGSHDPLQVSKGRLPQRAPDPIVPPAVATHDPIVKIQPAVDLQKDIKLPDNPNLPNFGISSSPSVVLSNGSGASGMGSGKGGGVGSGTGAGVGPGYGGNTGGGPRRIGDGVTEPKPIFAPEAEFSDEARRAKYEGTVVVTLIVDAQGNPQNVHVTRSLGMGLDEKALEAVRQYKFKPAMDKSTNKPVPVLLSIEVRFRLY